MERHSFSKIVYCIFVGALFIIGAFFALDHLTDAPPTWFDEGVNLQVSMNEALHGVYGIQIAPHQLVSGSSFITTGYPVLLPISLAFKFFGIGLLQARLVMACFILAALLMLFLLAKRLHGPMAAAMSLLLLVTFAPLYGNGKNVIGEVPGMFFLGTFLYALAHIERVDFRSRVWYVIAGVAAGLCIATKPIFFLVGLAVLISVVLYRKSIVWRWDLITWGTIAFSLPLIAWMVLTFSQNSPLPQQLAFYANPSAISQPLVQILKNARLFTQTSPFYFLLIELAWVGATLLRYRRKIYLSLTETVGFVFSLLLCVAFFHTYGDYRYFFPAEILGITFLAHSLRVLFQHSKIPKGVSSASLTVIAILILCSIQTHELFSGSFVSAYTASHATEEYEAYFSGVSSSTVFFVYNVPVAVPFLPGQNYYQYINGQLGTTEFGANNLDLVRKGVPDMLIIGSSGDLESLGSSTADQYEIVTTLKKFVVAKRKK